MNSVNIELNGKKLKCVFGLGFLGECLENLDLTVTQIGEKLDKNAFKYVPILMYESVKYNIVENEGKEIDFTLKDLISWFDDDDDPFGKMNQFVIAFVKSVTKNVPKEEVEPSNSKKK